MKAACCGHFKRSHLLMIAQLKSSVIVIIRLMWSKIPTLRLITLSSLNSKQIWPWQSVNGFNDVEHIRLETQDGWLTSSKRILWFSRPNDLFVLVKEFEANQKHSYLKKIPTLDVFDSNKISLTIYCKLSRLLYCNASQILKCRENLFLTLIKIDSFEIVNNKRNH